MLNERFLGKSEKTQRSPWKNWYRQTISVALIICLQGCVATYRQFPRNKVGANAPAKVYGKMTYQISGVSISGGYLAINEAFKSKSPFSELESLPPAAVTSIPQEGAFIHVRIRNIMPSLGSLVFGYISLSTLTLLPAWSTKDGSDIFYQLYQNGQLVKTFEYSVRRKAGLWILLLPFIWANVLTYSEEQAFEATALQFFEDAAPLFSAAP